MEEIVILDTYPTILTKDKSFIELLKQQGMTPENKGRVILLPEDAVLVAHPIITYKEV